MRLIGILIILSLFSCEEKIDPRSLDYRKEMKSFIIEISKFAKSKMPGFLIVPQNGVELLAEDETYISSIDAQGQEDLFYGYVQNNEPTPNSENSYLINYLNILKNKNKQVFVTDYCSSLTKMDDSYQQNNRIGFVSFAANKRELDAIPAFPSPIYNENDEDVNELNQVTNFIYLINPGAYESKQDFINDITATNFDLLIMDLFFEDLAFEMEEIQQLKKKKNGGSRLILAYLSIGEAEDYRYYWNTNWNANKPEWLANENRNWPGNYKVKYWHPEWQQIIFNSEKSYLKKIINTGFDGVYLDLVDAYEYFE